MGGITKNPLDEARAWQTCKSAPTVASTETATQYGLRSRAAMASITRADSVMGGRGDEEMHSL